MQVNLAFLIDGYIVCTEILQKVTSRFQWILIPVNEMHAAFVRKMLSKCCDVMSTSGDGKLEAHQFRRLRSCPLVFCRYFLLPFHRLPVTSHPVIRLQFDWRKRFIGFVIQLNPSKFNHYPLLVIVKTALL